MASFIGLDGHVQAPSNIAAPAPSLNTQGFSFGTVDNKVQLLETKIEELAFEAQAELSQTHLPAPQPALPSARPEEIKKKPDPPLFPLTQLQGSFAGNGFNMIWRPRPENDTTPFEVPVPADVDNVLELNLTTEQITFESTLGPIPNRGLMFNKQPDIDLSGFPYIQTVHDVTNKETGHGDNPIGTDIHFENGLWLNVPVTRSAPKNAASVVRMASIPHGTTINAQGLAGEPNVNHLDRTSLGGMPGPPDFDAPQNIADTTPFELNDPSKRVDFFAAAMDADTKDQARIPQDLTIFKKTGTITSEIIKNPNRVLANAIKGLTIRETISWEVSTGPPTAKLNGGGTANISFLAGTQDPITTAAPGEKDMPNAHAAFMSAKYWVESVVYEVVVPRLTTREPMLLKPVMPEGSTAPAPVFAITPPAKLPTEPKKILVPGLQIQSSQTVNLNFGPEGSILTWPHVSVATMVPKNPQPFTMLV